MDFELTEEQRALQQTVREFAASELKPGAARRDETGEFPQQEINKLRQLGLLGLPFPTAYGGGGRDFVSYAIAVEELARVDASITITLLAHTLCASHIFAFGTEEQKRKYLVPLVTGEQLGAWALTEPVAGSDAGAIRTEAIQDDGIWRLNGSKFFITNGSRADILVIMASTDPARKSKGISAFIVTGDTVGLIKGKNLDKLGFRSSDTVGLRLKDVRLPKENLLGELHQGFIQAMEVLEGGRIGSGIHGGRNRQGLSRGKPCLCPETSGLRPPHRTLPGNPVDARRHGNRAGCRTVAGLESSHAEGYRKELCQGSLHGEALRLGGSHAGFGQGCADSWRLWLHAGFPGGALHAGGKAVRDRRGNVGDSTPGNRTGAALGYIS